MKTKQKHKKLHGNFSNQNGVICWSCVSSHENLPPCNIHHSFPALFMSNRSPVCPPALFSWQPLIDPANNNPPKTSEKVGQTGIIYNSSFLSVWNSTEMLMRNYGNNFNFGKLNDSCLTVLLSVTWYSIPRKIQHPCQNGKWGLSKAATDSISDTERRVHCV